MQKDARHIELISKYLAEEATSAEIVMLENWVLEKDENKALFNKYRQAWILTNNQGSKTAINIDEEWAKMNSRLFSGKGKVVALDSRKRNFFILRIAAAVLFLIAAALWFLIPRGEHTHTLYAETRMEEIILPDGSNISVNKNSSISYPDKFDKKQRTVSLAGDAFFEVTHRPEQPFVIETQDITIKVLGTSFYVNSKASDPDISVIVRTGKVAMISGEDKITLAKGEKGIYHKATHKLEKFTNEDLNYLAWKTQVYTFNEKFADIVKRLNKIYGSNIILNNEALNDCTVNVTIYKNQSLQSVLHVIRETLDIKIREMDGKILISGGKCG